MIPAKKTILILIVATLLIQFALPVVFASADHKVIVSPDSTGHHLVITADVCSKKLAGTVSVSLFPVKPALTILFILVVSIFLTREDKLFLPITSNQFFHPPRPW